MTTITLNIKESTNWQFCQLEQGGWVAATTIGSYPNARNVYLFAEDFDALTQKLKVHLTAEKLSE